MREGPQFAPPRFVVHAAIEAAQRSYCRSQRGAATFFDGRLLSVGFNQKPPGFLCDSSDACKASCRFEAVHAEQVALIGCLQPKGADMLHVKVVSGHLVPSGEPSCVECSKLILGAGLLGVWLFHEGVGWRRYGADDFHLRSLRFRQFGAHWEQGVAR